MNSHRLHRIRHWSSRRGLSTLIREYGTAQGAAPSVDVMPSSNSALRSKRALALLIAILSITIVAQIACQTEDDETAKALNDRGVEIAKSGDFEAAIRLFDEAIEVDTSYAKAHFNRGLCFDKMGLVDSAMLDYSSAIRADSSYVLPYFNRGLLLIDKGEVESARSDFERAYELDSSCIDALLQVALVLSRQQKLDSALTVLDSAISRRGNVPLYYNNRGEIYRKMQRFQSAKRDFAKVIQIDSTYAEVYHSLATLYHDLGDSELESENLKLFLEYTDSTDISRVDSIRDILDGLK